MGMVAWPQVLLCPPLELRCIWVWLSSDMGQGWGAICMGIWIVVGYHMPWNWPLSRQPHWHISVPWGKGECREAEAVSTSCLLSLGQALVPEWQRVAEQRTELPDLHLSRAQCGSEILEGWRECGAMLVAWKSRGTRTPDGAFDTEAQGLRVGSGTVAVEAPLKWLGGRAGARASRG